MREKIALFAGADELSKLAWQRLQAHYDVVLLSLRPLPFKAYSSYVIEVGNLEKLAGILREEKVKKIALVEKISAGEIFKSKLHASGRRLLQGLPDWQGETVLKGIADFLEKFGVRLIPLTEIFRPELTKKKVYTKRKPSRQEMKDVRLGLKIAGELIRYRIGQALALKNGMVLAVEGIEGTDRMIERTGDFSEDFVVIKMAGKNKDLRFDLPVIGQETIRVLKKARGRVLAVEAGKTIIVNQAKVVSSCNRFGMTLIGV